MAVKADTFHCYVKSNNTKARDVGGKKKRINIVAYVCDIC